MKFSLVIPDTQQEYEFMLQAWEYQFPTKPCPKKTSVSYVKQLRKLLNTVAFSDIILAIEHAATIDRLHTATWFTFSWLLHKPANVHKVLDGKYDFLNEIQTFTVDEMVNNWEMMTKEEKIEFLDRTMP